MSVTVLTAVKRKKICEKEEKYFKGKVVNFTVQSLILYQLSCEFTNLFGTLLKKF